MWCEGDHLESRNPVHQQEEGFLFFQCNEYLPVSTSDRLLVVNITWNQLLESLTVITERNEWKREFTFQILPEQVIKNNNFGVGLGTGLSAPGEWWISWLLKAACAVLSSVSVWHMLTLEVASDPNKSCEEADSVPWVQNPGNVSPELFWQPSLATFSDFTPHCLFFFLLSTWCGNLCAEIEIDNFYGFSMEYLQILLERRKSCLKDRLGDSSWAQLRTLWVIWRQSC